MSCDLFSIARGCDSFDVTFERGDERGHLLVALESPEAAFGVEHPGGAPPLDHLAVSPTLHVLGRVTRDRDHALDAVRVGERRGESAVDPEPPHGEHLVEAFAQARGRVGPPSLELGREVTCGTFALWVSSLLNAAASLRSTHAR